ncbi:hypothetical protein ACHAXS_005117 [Conticribra weissflogii]
MRQLGYTSNKADPDLWMKACTRETEYGVEKYYSYILIYVDDILCIHDDPDSIMTQIDKYFPLKPDSVGEPDMYLGAKLKLMQLENSVWAWGLSPSKYVQEAIRNCKKYVEENLPKFYKLTQIAPNPFPTDYRLELDVLPKLPPEHASYYQSLMGIFRWIIELGRIDISTEVSMLSSYMALPRQGHLEAALHVILYLGLHHNSRLCMDPTHPEIKSEQFPVCDWSEFYGEVEEPIPPNAPEALDKEVGLRMFLDSDHAGDKHTHRSQSRFLVYLNTALISWYSKKQSTIETCTFGAEFVAMKTGVETLHGIH